MGEKWIIDQETNLVLGHASGRRIRLPRMSRLSYLMALYQENFGKLTHWFDVHHAPVGVRWSLPHSGLDVRVEVVAQHVYTTELVLSYDLRDPDSGQLDPSANIRVYHDTQQAEVTHCYAGRGWQDVIGMAPPSEMLYAHRLQMNIFLSKWLEFLAEQGHGSTSRWEPDETRKKILTNT